MSIVLIGLKHSGKSSVGKLLAEHLQQPFYDSDVLLEAHYAHKVKNGHLSCREIYLRLGKQGFDRLQLEVLEKFFQENSKCCSVLALGGGAGDLLGLGVLLRANPCCVILLQEALEAIFMRIEANGLPPFLQDAPEPFAEFQRLGEQRLRNYRSWAHIVIECQGRGVPEILEELLQRVEARL